MTMITTMTMMTIAVVLIDPPWVGASRECLPRTGRTLLAQEEPPPDDDHHGGEDQEQRELAGPDEDDRGDERGEPAVDGDPDGAEVHAGDHRAASPRPR